jgi:hypothetical protein
VRRRLVIHYGIERFLNLSTGFTRAAALRFIPANAKNIHRAIHALFVTFPQPPPLYFHNMEKMTGAMK